MGRCMVLGIMLLAVSVMMAAGGDSGPQIVGTVFACEIAANMLELEGPPISIIVGDAVSEAVRERTGGV